MPEIPDLVVFRDNLNKLLKGKKLATIESYDPKGPETGQLQAALNGKKLTDITREGKELWFHFGKKNVLAIHLMLTGKFKLEEKENKAKSSLALLHFEPTHYLYVNDRPSYIRAFIK